MRTAGRSTTLGLVVVRVDVAGDLISWARERSGVSVEDLVRKFPKLPRWESGEASPTLKQLESFANATHAPIGYFFLPEPPEEAVPLPDFRTMQDQGVGRPSPDLLDTVFQTEQRQEWYKDYVRTLSESE